MADLNINIRLTLEEKKAVANFCAELLALKDDEKEILKMIRSHKDPAQAMKIATEICRSLRQEG